LDIDAMQKRVYGHKKQAAFGHTKIQGKSLLVLNALAATISTPIAAPVIAATRLRGGNANSARGAASFAAQSVTTARAAGCGGKIVVRMDSAYYGAAVIGAMRRARAHFFGHCADGPEGAGRDHLDRRGRLDPSSTRAPCGMTSCEPGCREAEVAEVEYTAFASKKGQAITARLIVRRVKDRNRQDRRPLSQPGPPDTLSGHAANRLTCANRRYVRSSGPS
jgi:hypothetical protein